MIQFDDCAYSLGWVGEKPPTSYDSKVFFFQKVRVLSPAGLREWLQVSQGFQRSPIERPMFLKSLYRHPVSIFSEGDA